MGKIIGTENKQRLEQMREMRKNGMTHQEIADEFGLSRQRVHQLIGNRSRGHFWYVTEDRCKYEGLRNWMNENEVGVTELTRRIYHNAHPNNQANISYKLRGNQATIEFIERILDVTGLTYEEAFRKEKTDGRS